MALYKISNFWILPGVWAQWFPCLLSTGLCTGLGHRGVFPHGPELLEAAIYQSTKSIYSILLSVRTSTAMYHDRSKVNDQIDFACCV